jgi:hypothetical protein
MVVSWYLENESCVAILPDILKNSTPVFSESILSRYFSAGSGSLHIIGGYPYNVKP